MSKQQKLSARRLKHPYVSIDPKVSQGSPVITGTRIRIIDIAIEYDRLGLTPDQIIDAHPHLNLEAVHDALSYYYENRDSIDEEIREKKEIIREIAKKPINTERGHWLNLDFIKYNVGDLISRLKIALGYCRTKRHVKSCRIFVRK